MLQRSISRAAACLASCLHSHVALSRGIACRAHIGPKFAQGFPAAQRLSCTVRSYRELHTSAVLVRATSTETLSGTEGRMLIGKADAYEGFLVSPQDLPSTSSDFDTQLQNSLEDWRHGGIKGVWINIPAEKSELVPVAIKHGFQFHHAERAYVMLTRWLPDTENTLPPNASHQVGVGAFVLNSKREVLVVQERFGPLKGTGVWKMPTGLVLAGEDITEAAEREVMEETGLEAHFEAVLALRQSHKAAFGKSDMFFVVALKPTDESQELVAQVTEVDGVKWMPIDDFHRNPFSATKPLYSKLIDQCIAYANGKYDGLKAKNMASGWGDRSELLVFGAENPKL